ncbi:MAG: glycoside hydrolase family 9 protein [bacterium]
MNIILMFVVWLSLVMVSPLSQAGKSVDRVWVLSSEWVVLANDYMDETDTQMYAANKSVFDRLLVEQEALEQGKIPDWPVLKQRSSLWARLYVEMSEQHRWARELDAFSIEEDSTSGETRSRSPRQAVSWVNELGDRVDVAQSPLRACADYEVGHYSYLRLPYAMTNGSALRIRQKDGRVALINFNDNTLISPAIKVNQAGYLCDAHERYAYLGAWIPTIGPVDYSGLKSFELCREEDGQSVWQGILSVRSTNLTYSGEIVYEMDFSAMHGSGRFYIRVPGLGRSWPFVIGPTALGEAFYVAARGFYHQRCGCKLEQPYTAWTRGRCHLPPVFACSMVGNGGDIWKDSSGRVVKDIKGLDFEVIKATGDSSIAYDIWGGWHDAADYDRRQSHHFAAWDLMGVYELNPLAFLDGQLNLPESGNGVPDLLDEVDYGLEVWRRAQRPDGAVCGRIETVSHPNHRGMPDEEHTPFFKSVETRESTLYYAASAAQLGWLLRPFDRRKSDEWVESATRAYAWAVRTNRHPASMAVTVIEKNRILPDGKRELFWNESPDAHLFAGFHAALQLYRVTSNETYRAELVQSFMPYALRFFDSYPNYIFQSWGVFEVATWQGGGMPETDRRRATEMLIARADEAVREQEATPYRHPWNPQKSRRWGAALSATQARYCILAWKLTGKERYRTAALHSADFHLGCNALGLSQTTGLGSYSIGMVQDAESRADGLLEPVPGITPYGIVSVPAGERNHVYSMTVGTSQASHPDYFLPPPFDVPKPPIPLWRQYGPNGWHDPLNNEFTLQETLSPLVLLFGSLLGPGWQPSEELKNRVPKSRSEMNGYFWLP